MNAEKASFLRHADIEHIMRAVSGISGQAAFVLMGAGAVIAQLRTTPLSLMGTRELDVYASDADDIDEVSTLIDASIGEGSLFDETFGYHAHGIGPTTAILPRGWQARAKEITWPSLPGVTCLCPDVDDIALSKVCAWREKDVRWLSAARQSGLLNLGAIRERIVDVQSPNVPTAAEFERRLNVLSSSNPEK